MHDIKTILESKSLTVNDVKSLIPQQQPQQSAKAFSAALLREYLKAHNLSQAGSKLQMVNRIRSHMGLESHIKIQKSIQLSQLQRKFLDLCKCVSAQQFAQKHGVQLQLINDSIELVGPERSFALVEAQLGQYLQISEKFYEFPPISELPLLWRQHLPSLFADQSLIDFDADHRIRVISNSLETASSALSDLLDAFHLVQNGQNVPVPLDVHMLPYHDVLQPDYIARLNFQIPGASIITESLESAFRHYHLEDTVVLQLGRVLLASDVDQSTESGVNSKGRAGLFIPTLEPYCRLKYSNQSEWQTKQYRRLRLSDKRGQKLYLQMASQQESQNFIMTFCDRIFARCNKSLEAQISRLSTSETSQISGSLDLLSRHTIAGDDYWITGVYDVEEQLVLLNDGHSQLLVSKERNTITGQSTVQGSVTLSSQSDFSAIISMLSIEN
ncbi:hypothetical protein MIR68_003807 [Amoeboaphelidium protococcarum]|nr:hypothetical protein MIR68_003807 [Amoeboaphelidium protococcarum]